MSTMQTRARLLAPLTVAVLGLTACSAGVSIGNANDITFLPPLASNGDDFTLAWATTDTSGNVVEDLLLTTLPGADLDAHFYALEDYGINRSLATACGYDPAKDLLIDGYARATSSTLIAPVDDSLAFGFTMDGTLAPVGLTLVWFDVTDNADGTFKTETHCVEMPDASVAVFYFDGYSFTKQGGVVGFNFYLMLTDYYGASPDGATDLLTTLAIHPDVESAYIDTTVSITGGTLLLDGTYQAD